MIQNRSLAYQITYGFKKKEKFNLYHHTHRIRLKYFYRPSDVWQFQTECSGVGAYKSGSSMHYGGLIGEFMFLGYQQVVENFGNLCLYSC